MSHIFTSYARKDIDFAQKVVDALAANDLDTWIDWKSIPKGEDWVQEINRGIEEADAFLFLVSPDSVIADGCNKEIEHAVKNGKRILPIVIRDTDIKSIHSEISKRNWIFCRDGQDDFNKAIEETRETIHTDYEWLKFHTRLQNEALVWERSGKETSYLLHEKELKDTASIFVVSSGKEPSPTDVQRQYILASQINEESLQKNEERRRRQITIGLSLGFVIMAILFVFAWNQKNSALNSEATAIAEANARATAQSNAEQQARVSRAGELVAQAQGIANTFPQRGLLLAVEAARQRLDAGESITPNTSEALRNLLARPWGISLQNPIGQQEEFSPDRRWLVLHNEQSLQLWDLDAGKPWLEPTAEYPLMGVNTIQFSPNSQHLLFYSNTRIQILDLIEQEVVSRFDLSVENSNICNATMEPNGDWVVITQCDGKTNYWNIKNPALLPIEIKPKNTEANFYEHAISPDGSWFVLYGKDSSSQLWQFRSDTTPQLKIEELDALDIVKFSTDSQWLFITRNIQERKHLFAFSLANTMPENGKFDVQTPDFFSDILLSDNGNWMAILNDDPGDEKKIYIYNLLKKPASTVPTIIETDQQPDYFRITNQWIIVGKSNQLLLWKLDEDQNELQSVVLKLPPNTLSYDISPDGYWLTTVTFNGQIRVWNLDTFNPEPLILSGQDSALNNTIYSSDHSWLATISEDKTIRIWSLNDPQSAAPKQLLRGHDTDIYYAFFSDQDRWLVTTEAAGLIRLWPMSTLNETNNSMINSLYSSQSIDLKGHNQYISDIAITPNFKLLASGDLDGYFRLWDLRSDPIRLLFEIHPFDVSVNAIKISPDGRWLAVSGSGQETLLWDLSKDITEEPTYLLPGHDKAIELLAFSPNSHVLASGGADGRILLWELDNQGPASFPIELCCSSINFIDGGHGITTLIFSPDNLRLFSGDVSGLGALWDLYDLREPIRLMHSESAPIISAAFSHSGRWLVSGGSDFRTLVWDMNSLAEPKVIEPEKSQSIVDLSGKRDNGIIGLAFTPDDKQLIVISNQLAQENDNNIYFWNMDKLETYNTNAEYNVRGPNTKITSWGISPDGKSLAVGSGTLAMRNGPQTSLYFWDLNDIESPPINFPGGAIEIRKLLFSNDGKWLVTGDADVHIYSLQNNDLLKAACFSAARNFTQFEWEMYFPSIPYRETCTNLPNFDTNQSKPNDSGVIEPVVKPIQSSNISRWSIGVIVLYCFSGISTIIVLLVLLSRSLKKK